MSKSWLLTRKCGAFDTLKKATRDRKVLQIRCDVCRSSGALGRSSIFVALDVCREKLVLHAQVVRVEVGFVLLVGEPAHVMAPTTSARSEQTRIFALESVEGAPFAFRTGFVRMAALS